MFNSYQTAALTELNAYGLTNEHLINLVTYPFNKNDSRYFDFAHQNALIYLVKEKKFSISDALTEIRETTIDEAAGITKGLGRKHVLDLNRYQIASLLAFQADGLTREHLLNLKTYSFDRSRTPTFTHDHYCALVSLIKERKFSLSDALAEIHETTSNEAFGIHRGLNRKHVFDLNSYQIASLLAFRADGLTREHLVSLKTYAFDRDDDSICFEETHFDTLFYLIKERNFSVLDALAAISEMTIDEAKGIAQGLAREQVFGLTAYQITTLAVLYKDGLTREHLLALQTEDPNNDRIPTLEDSHHDASMFLIKEKNSPSLTRLLKFVKPQ